MDSFSSSQVSCELLMMGFVIESHLSEERLSSMETILFQSLMSQTGRTQRWLSSFAMRLKREGRFFQIVNHGIPLEMLEKAKAATYRFCREPAEEKKKYSKENSATCHLRRKLLNIIGLLHAGNFFWNSLRISGAKGAAAIMMDYLSLSLERSNSSTIGFLTSPRMMGGTMGAKLTSWVMRASKNALSSYLRIADLRVCDEENESIAKVFVD
nr:feruloyl CoA ortho-hydroxylase 1-like [Ipomoea trifida]